MRLQPLPEPRTRKVIRRVLTAALVIHLPIWAASSYAAWFQVYSLELGAPAGPVAPGAAVRADVVSSGRVWVDVRLELEQGGQVRRLGWQRVPGNGFAGYDQRPHPDSLRVVVTADQLRGFASGPATLRAIATGRPQWTRTPPPTVRERRVTIVPPPPSHTS